jgi:formyl-CoA transferase
MSRPLEGIRVLDLGQIYAVPYCTLQMAAMGADIIKIEPPGRGESLRALADPTGVNYSFLMLNANKKSLTLNLKDPRGRAILMRLLERADVIIENFGAGTMESLGLGYDELSEKFPRLIYASAKGYAAGSRYERVGAMDSTIQAACGFINATGYPDGNGVRTPSTFIDMGTGSHITTAVVAALFDRERRGRGQKVEVAMLDVAMPAMTSLLQAALQGRPIKRPGTRHPGVAPTNVYPTADGELLLFCVTEKHWQEVARLAGRADLIDDPRFADHASRVQIVDEVDEVVGAWTLTLTRDALMDILIERGIPAAPVRTVHEIVANPEAAGTGMLLDSHYPLRGAIRVLGSPLRFSSDDRTTGPTPPPMLGADTDAILGEIGIGADERAHLRTAGII